MVLYIVVSSRWRIAARSRTLSSGIHKRPVLRSATISDRSRLFNRRSAWPTHHPPSKRSGQCLNWPKRTGGSSAERNVWNFAKGISLRPIFTQKWASVDMNWGGGVQPQPLAWVGLRVVVRDTRPTWAFPVVYCLVYSSCNWCWMATHNRCTCSSTTPPTDAIPARWPPRTASSLSTGKPSLFSTSMLRYFHRTTHSLQTRYVLLYICLSVRLSTIACGPIKVTECVVTFCHQIVSRCHGTAEDRVKC